MFLLYNGWIEWLCQDILYYLKIVKVTGALVMNWVYNLSFPPFSANMCCVFRRVSQPGWAGSVPVFPCFSQEVSHTTLIGNQQTFLHHYSLYLLMKNLWNGLFCLTVYNQVSKLAHTSCLRLTMQTVLEKVMSHKFHLMMDFCHGL